MMPFPDAYSIELLGTIVVVFVLVDLLWALGRRGRNRHRKRERPTSRGGRMWRAVFAP